MTCAIQVDAAAQRGRFETEGTVLARSRLFGDIVIAALISAAATAPIAGYVAYANHTEAMTRIGIDQARQSSEVLLAQRRFVIEQRQAACAGALHFLEDDKTNPALPAAEAKLLLEDMRRTASSCNTAPSSERPTATALASEMPAG